MTDQNDKKAGPPTENPAAGSTPELSAEEFLKILHLPACKSKGYCDNCGRCER